MIAACTSHGVMWLQGSGSSDFMDALTVAVDKLHREVNNRPDLGRQMSPSELSWCLTFWMLPKKTPTTSLGLPLWTTCKKTASEWRYSFSTEHAACNLYAVRLSLTVKLEHQCTLIASANNAMSHCTRVRTICCTARVPAHKAMPKHAQKM